MPFLGASFLPTNGTSFIPIIKPQAVYLKLVHLSEYKLYIKVSLFFFFNLKLCDDSCLQHIPYNRLHTVAKKPKIS